MKFSTKTTQTLISNSNLHKFLKLNLVNENCYLGGGALRHLFNKDDTIDDYDMFFKDIQSGVKTKLELENMGAEKIFECPLGKLTTFKHEDMKIQLITEFFYDNPLQMIDTFDVNACRICYDGQHIYTRYSAYRDCKKKQITLNEKFEFPMATMKRIGKYINKGFALKTSAIKTFVSEVYNLGIKSTPMNDRVYID